MEKYDLSDHKKFLDVIGHCPPLIPLFLLRQNLASRPLSHPSNVIKLTTMYKGEIQSTYLI